VCSSTGTFEIRRSAGDATPSRNFSASQAEIGGVTGRKALLDDVLSDADLAGSRNRSPGTRSAVFNTPRFAEPPIS
jgi:hypothetical protein